MRKNPYLRDKNAVIAYQFLPFFEENPSRWNAVRDLPESTGVLTDYLSDWVEKADPAHKQFVKHIERSFQ